MGSIERRVEEIRKIPALAFLSDEDLRTLAQAGQELLFKKGDTLLVEGSTGSEVYAIISGQCDVVTGGKPVAVVGSYQLVGEMAVISPERRSATITARTDGLAYVLSGFDFRSALQTNPKMVLQLFKGMATRLRKAQMDIAELQNQLTALQSLNPGAGEEEPPTSAPPKKKRG